MSSSQSEALGAVLHWLPPSPECLLERRQPGTELLCEGLLPTPAASQGDRALCLDTGVSSTGSWHARLSSGAADGVARRPVHWMLWLLSPDLKLREQWLRQSKLQAESLGSESGDPAKS